MVISTQKEVLVASGHSALTKSLKEVLKATRVATSVVIVVYDPQLKMGGMCHIPLPDSRMANRLGGDSPGKYMDLALPLFIEELVSKGFHKTQSQVKIVGGSQLFNFGGGGGNLLNIGTRNAIAARTILSREGITVEKTETGGNKPRTVLLEIESGYVRVFHPGETPRVI